MVLRLWYVQHNDLAAQVPVTHLAHAEPPWTHMGRDTIHKKHVHARAGHGHGCSGYQGKARVLAIAVDGDGVELLLDIPVQVPARIHHAMGVCSNAHEHGSTATSSHVRVVMRGMHDTPDTGTERANQSVFAQGQGGRKTDQNVNAAASSIVCEGQTRTIDAIYWRLVPLPSRQMVMRGHMHQEKLIYLDKAIMAFLAEQLHNKAIQAFLNQSPWQPFNHCLYIANNTILNITAALYLVSQVVDVIQNIEYKPYITYPTQVQATNMRDNSLHGQVPGHSPWSLCTVALPQESSSVSSSMSVVLREDAAGACTAEAP
ncbi:hypothetical protein C8Q72DRAFT_795302 [Fomitopsis betulina]|nr:hypothetical protein C8Q72DRAFT_795302 [Fomitopsis betulina]